MKIYTKKGDAGETGLYGGARIAKDALRIRTYGTFDELNAALGLVAAEEKLDPELRTRLLRVQGELFQLGAELATPMGKTVASKKIDDEITGELETEIDAMESQLPPLKTFILPGGTRAAALLHLARTISRRAERELITLHKQESIRAEVLRYSNRLSDYFFVCARYANFKAGTEDVPWISS